MELVVLAQSALPTKPVEGALHNPATWQDLEAENIVVAFYDLKPDAIARA
jgi:hypothetical protein